MVKHYKKISKVYTRISKKLHDEIKLSQKSLNKIEKNKGSGKKKNYISFLEASDSLGQYLNSLRTKNNYNKKNEL